MSGCKTCGTKPGEMDTFCLLDACGPVVNPLRKRVEALEEENRLLRGALIRHPDELHRVSEAVEKLGFGKKEKRK